MGAISGIYDKVSLGATVRTTALPVNGPAILSWAVKTTGTAAGTWRVQYSATYIDGVDDPTSDAKWDEFTLTTTPPDAAGVAQTFGIVIDNFEFRWARVKFTRSGGTGTAELWSNWSY